MSTKALTSRPSTAFAADLDESEDWLFDIACEMDADDGVIWIRGLADNAAMAFTDFGIENLIELIKIHKDDPTLMMATES